MGQALDVQAFAELFARTREPLYAYAAGLLLDRAAAEDVVQRAFELAFAKRVQFRPELGSADAWLFGIARHVALDERRRMRRRLNPSPEAEPADAGATDARLERADHRSAIIAALSTLSDTDRELIALRFWLDLSYGEIAALTGCSESNVGTRLSRAINKVREVWDDV